MKKRIYWIAISVQFVLWMIVLGHKLGNVPNTSEDNCNISNVVFTGTNVLKAVSWITKSKFAGDPDGYPVILLQKLRFVLCGPLSWLYNSFMSIGRVPDEWKKAIVTQLNKKSISFNPANYRPISQTSIFNKLMGRVISAELIVIMFCRKRLLPNTSTVSSLNASLQPIYYSLNDWKCWFRARIRYWLIWKTELQASSISGSIIVVEFRFLAWS